jgi:hypothetical protein
MSEKYSTEVMINFLEDCWGTAVKGVRLSIIAKLRAADKLYKATKRLGSKYTSDSNLTQFERRSLLDKAIAKYEGTG